MRIEINNENKAKFLDLYIGQESDNSSPAYSKISRSLNDMISIGIGDYAVKLKPLSSISDADAAYVCRLFSSQFPDDLVAAVQGRLLITEYIRRASNLTGFNWFLALDCLRSKGYALPWMGLSVDEMVKAGWIKLIK